MLAIATLVVSIVMTGLTFFALNGIQTEARMGDTRYARDLGLLLASNVTPLAAQGNDRELARVTEEFWRSSRSLRYIFYADPEGVIYLGIPISKVDSGNDLLLSRRLELPLTCANGPKTPDPPAPHPRWVGDRCVRADGQRQGLPRRDGAWGQPQ